MVFWRRNEINVLIQFFSQIIVIRKGGITGMINRGVPPDNIRKSTADL